MLLIDVRCIAPFLVNNDLYIILLQKLDGLKAAV